MRRSWDSQKGSLLLITMLALMMMSFSVGTLMYFGSQQRRALQKERDAMGAFAGMKSALAYVKKMILAGSCMDLEGRTFVQVPCPSDQKAWSEAGDPNSPVLNPVRFTISDEDLTHPNTGLNVLLGRKTTDRKFLLGDANRPWRGFIDLSALGPYHPLKPIFQNFSESFKIGTLMVQVSLVYSKHLPEKTRVIKLSIIEKEKSNILDWVNQGESPYFLGHNKDYAVTETFMVAPKAIGEYALVVPGDLDLSLRVPELRSAKKDLDVLFPARDRYRSDFRGLVLGDLYVGGNVKLPRGDHFNHVSFSGQVSLGATAKVLRRVDNNTFGSPTYEAFLPKTAGGLADRFLAQLPGIGSFSSGLSHRAVNDKGAPYLFGSSASNYDDRLARQCLNLANTGRDPRLTAGASLVVRERQAFNSGASNSVRIGSYYLGYTDRNLLIPQIGLKARRIEFRSGQDGGQPIITSAKIRSRSRREDRPAAKLAMEFFKGDHVPETGKGRARAVFHIERDSEVTVQLQRHDASSLERKYFAAKKAYEQRLEEKSKAESDLPDAKNDFLTANSALTADIEQYQKDQQVFDQTGPVYGNTVKKASRDVALSALNTALNEWKRRVSEWEAQPKIRTKQARRRGYVTNYISRLRDARNKARNLHTDSKTSFTADDSALIDAWNTKFRNSRLNRWQEKEDAVWKLETTIHNFQVDEASLLKAREDAYDAWQNLLSLDGIAPRIIVRAYPEKRGKHLQPNFFRFDVQIENEGALQYSFRLDFAGYDVMHNGFGIDQRPRRHALVSNRVQLPFELMDLKNGVGGRVRPPAVDRLWRQFDGNQRLSRPPNPPNPNGDFYAVLGDCDEKGQAFGPLSNWLQVFDFSPQTQFRWEITHRRSEGKQLHITQDPVGGAGFRWSVYSIVSECHVYPNVGVVTGFKTCDKVIIHPGRSKSLWWIGTLITKEIVFKDYENVAKTGLRFSSLLEPEAIVKMQRMGLLGKGRSCDKLWNAPGSQDPHPVWHPWPDTPLQSLQNACNPLQFLKINQPFGSWTQLDPKCGLLPGAPFVRCKPPIRPVLNSVTLHAGDNL